MALEHPVSVPPKYLPTMSSSAGMLRSCDRTIKEQYLLIMCSRSVGT